MKTASPSVIAWPSCISQYKAIPMACDLRLADDQARWWAGVIASRVQMEEAQVGKGS